MPSIQLKLLIQVLLAALLFAGGYGVRAYIAKHDATTAALEQEKAVTAALAEHAQRYEQLLAENQALQNQVTSLDSQHTRDLNDQLAENNRLRTDLAAAQRMRLTGTKCPQAGTSSDDSSSGGLGDGAGVELSESTRLAVWDLRAAIIADRAKVTYLQDYVRTVCLKPSS